MGAYSQGGGGGPAGSGTQIDANQLDKPYDLQWPWSAEQVQKLDEMLHLLFLSATKLSNVTSTGDVTGPSSSIDGDIVKFSGTTGKVLADGGKLATDLVTGPASVTADGNIALFNGTTGKIIKDGGSLSNVNIAVLGGSISVVQAVLTDTQIKSLNSSPVTVVPAPADVTHTLIPISWVLRPNQASGGYSTGRTVNLVYTGKTDLLMDGSPTAIQTTLNYRPLLLGNSLNQLNISAGYDAAGLGIDIKSTADVTGGGSNNTLKMIIIFAEVDFNTAIV